MNKGLKICLAESGGLKDEERTQSLYKGTSLGHPIRLTEGRHRVFGGSTTKWGGRSAMLDPIDFENRDWVQNSSWPITWAELEPYYERAKKAGNFGDLWLDDERALASIDKTLPTFETSEITPFVWRFASPDLHDTPSPRPRIRLGARRSFDWRRAYRSLLKQAPDVSIVLHANLIDLDPSNESDAIRSARFKALNGRSLEINAKVFVICCSAIENARILLNLNPKLATALPSEDNIGRYFAQHPRGPILTVEANREESLRLQRAFNKFAVRDHQAVQYELGFALSEQAQRTHKLLNASAGLRYSASYWKAAKRLRDALESRSYYSGAWGDVGQLFLGSFSLLSNIWTKYVTGAPPVFPGGTIKVVADLEQEPRRDSRVILSDDRDKLGVPRTVVDWRISEIERTTARKFAEAVADELHRLGLGKAKLEPWLTSNDPITEEHLAGNYHLIGTTRMAKTPEDGVVDENARVFGLSNLYVAGSSVFSTGGHANPTLTIVALAIRLADHLKDGLSVL